MATDNDYELPQTQSQTNNLEETFSQLDDNSLDAWGRLTNKSKLLRTVDLTTESYTVGRSVNCDYDLDKCGMKKKHVVQISKNHFKITRDLSAVDNPVYIEDNSRNGTFINEIKIGNGNKRILATGDIIAVAHPKLQVFQFQDFRHTPNPDLPEEITAKFYLQKKLGSGACGTVYLAHEYHSCGVFALKHIKKNSLAMKCDDDKSMNEARIMKQLTHPCIVKMYDIVNRPESVFIKLEFMEGGELLTRIQKQKFLTESNSKLFFYQMCDAIKYLHEQKITHRDLKPDNILLASSDENTLLKISDFGLSKLVRNNSVLRTLCGTPLYVAPEVLLTNGKGAYTEKVDIWSLGVVLFTMLSGTLPFADDYGPPVADQIKKGTYQFRSSNWLKVSNMAKDLIRNLLTTEVERRPSINDLLRAKWLDYSTISMAHSIMGIPLPHHIMGMRGTRMAMNVPQCVADSTSGVFALPFVTNENVQQPKRRRLR